MNKTVIKSLIVVVLFSFVIGFAIYTDNIRKKVNEEIIEVQPIEPITTIEAERASVENHIRENISQLSPVSPVLGGTWYVVSVTFDESGKSGMVVYEDGHIQEQATFSYEWSTATGPSIKNFTVVE